MRLCTTSGCCEVDLGIDIDKEGDPPRVWCQDHNYPGTAFSRSLGNSIRENLGVNAEPEVVTRGNKILVIATDGVFAWILLEGKEDVGDIHIFRRQRNFHQRN